MAKKFEDVLKNLYTHNKNLLKQQKDTLLQKILRIDPKDIHYVDYPEDELEEYIQNLENAKRNIVKAYLDECMMLYDDSKEPKVQSYNYSGELVESLKDEDKKEKLTLMKILEKNNMLHFGGDLTTDGDGMFEFCELCASEECTTPRAKKPDGSPNIDWLCIHYTAGASSKDGKAQGTAEMFAEHNRDASSDFIVDDAHVIQYNLNPEERYCWVVGDTKNENTVKYGGAKYNGICKNSNSISIEVSSNLAPGFNSSNANHKGWYFTKATLDNVATLAGALMEKYGIDKDHVLRHFDVTGKVCPGIYGWNTVPMEDGSKNNEDNWIRFRDGLSSGQNNAEVDGIGVRLECRQ